jgi:hypothetical protein
MFLFSNLPNNELLFNDKQNTFVVFKIDTHENSNDLIEVDDFVNLIIRNHELFLSLEAIIENKFTERMFNRERNKLKIPFRRSPNIKLNKVSKQSPTIIEFAVSGFQLGFNIAELLNMLLKKGANSDEFKKFLLRFNIPLELTESLSQELD